MRNSTARLKDLATGLRFNRSRWYEPTVGRFLSEDPTGFEGGAPNLYRYGHHAPPALRAAHFTLPYPTR